MKYLISILFLILNVENILGNSSENQTVSNGKFELYDIEGEVYPPEYISSVNKEKWITNTKVYTKGGWNVGFIRSDGKFTIPKVPSGSYIIEILSENYVYEPLRVEINSKGKYRARKLNYIQSSLVTPVPYPLKLKPLGLARYFQPREQWRITDILFNPMILMMTVPLLCVLLLPRIMNDPETKKDMEQFGMPKYDMPEVSEMITSFFSGGTEKQTTRTSSIAGRSGNPPVASRAGRKANRNN